jgi:hypothetical protein
MIVVNDQAFGGSLHRSRGLPIHSAGGPAGGPSVNLLSVVSHIRLRVFSDRQPALSSDRLPMNDDGPDYWTSRTI